MKLILRFMICTALAYPAAVAGESGHAKIGVIVPLVGPLAEYGTAIRNGFMLAEEDDPSLSSCLNITWEDSRSDTKVAVSAYEKLAAQDPIELVFVWGTTPTEGVAPVAQRLGKPLLAMSISPTVAKNRPLVARTVGAADRLIRPLLEHLKTFRYHRIALLKAEWSYTEELARELRAGLGSNVTVEEFGFNRSDADFLSTISRIRLGRFDAVGVFLGTGQISVFFRQAAQLRLKIPFFGSDFFGSQKEISEAGPGINGAVFPHLISCSTFDERYQKRFGNDTHIAYALNAYDMAKLLTKEAASLKTPHKLFDLVARPGQRSGVCGNFQYFESEDRGKYFDYPVALYRVEGGRAVIIKG